MKAGLRALLEGVIDYAGLFPPAQLPLDEATHNYADYRRQPEAWMLGRFVVPASRLAELDPYVSTLFASGAPLDLVALGRQAESVADWLGGVRADAEAIAAFHGRHGGRVGVEGYETRLPGQVLVEGGADRLASYIRSARDVLGALPAFFEAGPSGSNSESRDRILACLVDTGAGYKLRAGGLTAAAIPSADVVASTLRACREAEVPLKLTAGLHHPLPRRDPGLQATMHGFVNVLTAGVLAGIRADEGTLVEILRDADPGHFRFDTGLRWQDRSATAEQIASTRQSGVLSFGSCSFDEPRDDLRGLGWL
jgi:hypothetical protein